MENSSNARVGFTLQKLICEKFGIIPISDEAINQFRASYDNSLRHSFENILDTLFVSLSATPITCTTFSVDEKGKDVPFNFILSDNSTLSIRTNMKGSKIAPRIVGQAGFDKLNIHFSSIYGKELQTQDDIKRLITFQIDEVLPTFFEYLFDADYIVWVYYENGKYEYHLIKGDVGVAIDYKKSNFSFTRHYDKWIESTTLKYKGKSIAEIQVHKKRSFKFRFIMKEIIPLLVKKNLNTEKLGITAEKAICDMFSLEMPESFLTRYSKEMDIELKPTLKAVFTDKLPQPIRHTGSDKGKRGGASKCSYDFILEGDKTLSLKTNTGRMVCPPEVGQPSAKTCYLYFKHLIDEDFIDEDIFKRLVYSHINDMLPIYLDHMFESDFLLWIYKNEQGYDFKILERDFAKNMKWDFNKISFTKEKIEDWIESNTLKYEGTSIGEFQVHRNRDCLKFRFNFENLITIIGRYSL